MELSIYNVIVGPVITDKAYKLNKREKKLVLKVHPEANKVLVKKALEKLFDVEVDKVNIENRQGKNRMVKRRVVKGPLRKIAYVTLAKGYSLDLFDQAGAGVNIAEEKEKTSRKSAGNEE